MLVSAPDGRGIEVRRRWFPWRLRKRDIKVNGGDALSFIDIDDLGGLVFSIVLAVVFVLFGGIILTMLLFGFELVLLLLLLVPVLALARVFWVLPWIVEAAHGGETLGSVAVRGWRDSEAKIREIAAAYQRGEDPFAPTGYTVH